LIYSKNGELMIEIKDDWCKGCGICIERCPVNALEDSDKLNRKGICPPRLKEKNECNFCRLCELLCPDFALMVIPEEEAKKDVKKPLLSPAGGKNK
jgi:2-oxoglutarate ferredoxin oxidoreductase subunit delta